MPDARMPYPAPIPPCMMGYWPDREGSTMIVARLPAACAPRRRHVQTPGPARNSMTRTMITIARTLGFIDGASNGSTSGKTITVRPPDDGSVTDRLPVRGAGCLDTADSVVRLEDLLGLPIRPNRNRRGASAGSGSAAGPSCARVPSATSLPPARPATRALPRDARSRPSRPWTTAIDDQGPGDRP